LQIPAFGSFVQRTAHEIPRRSPPSCRGWNDANAIMNAPLNVAFLPNIAQKTVPNNSQSDMSSFRISQTIRYSAQFHFRLPVFYLSDRELSCQLLVETQELERVDSSIASRIS
jgi:hypothetical protein